MKTPLRLCCYALLISVIGAFLFGQSWEHQMNTKSGRQRTVSTVVGIPYMRGVPENTELSDWAGDTPDGPTWLRVGSPPPKHAKVSRCVDDLNNRLFRFRSEIPDERARRTLAKLILQHFASTRSICEASHRFYDFWELYWKSDPAPGGSEPDSIDETWNASINTEPDASPEPPPRAFRLEAHD